MKTPPSSPEWEKVAGEGGQKFLDCLANPDFASLLQKSLREYSPWDKVRHWPMPPGIPAEWVLAHRENQIRGLRKAIPLLDNLGRPFSYWIPDSAMEKLHFLDRNARGDQVFGTGSLHEDKERYLATSLMEEAIASSQIEGAATTVAVAKEMLRTGRKPTDHSEQMILNNYNAIKEIQHLKEAPLAVGVLHRLHTLLTYDTLPSPYVPGQWRLPSTTPEDDIVIKDETGNILHRPPPPSELPQRMDAFIEFANDDSLDTFIHPVVKAILLHFWIGYDHPYPDGNGRTARAIFYWSMLRNGYSLMESISISQVVNQRRGDYKRAFLYGEDGQNDLTYFLIFHLEILDQEIKKVQRHITETRGEQEKASLLIRQFPNTNHRQRELLLNALTHPHKTYTIYKHQTIHQTVYQTARMDLLDLAKRGLLEKCKSGKTWVFLPSELLKNFGTG